MINGGALFVHLARSFELRNVSDPYVRSQDGRERDEALKVAKVKVANIKHEAVRALRAALLATARSVGD